MDTRIGLIGTGWVSALHIASLGKIAGVKIAAVAGNTVEKAMKIAAPIGAKAYDDYREMLKHENLDAVYILMPPHVHGEMEKACAAAVPAVFIEKPIANNLATAMELEAVFAAQGTIVASGYMMRYHDSVERTRGLYAARTDKPILLNGWWITPMPGPMWWRNKAQSGGQFLEQCTHLVDASLYIAGDITEVSAFATSGFMKEVPDYSVDDAMVVNVRFASGAVGNFTTGCFPQGELQSGIGMTVVSKGTQCSFKGWDMSLDIRHGSGHTESFCNAQTDVFEAQNRCFIEAVRCKSGAALRSTYRSAIETLKVTLAANESAASGKTVRL